MAATNRPDQRQLTMLEDALHKLQQTRFMTRHERIIIRAFFIAR
jgi:hypothetical protein